MASDIARAPVIRVLLSRIICQGKGSLKPWTQKTQRTGLGEVHLRLGVVPVVVETEAPPRSESQRGLCRKAA